MRTWKHMIVPAFAAMLLISTGQARAATYGFGAITANGIGSPEIGEAQLSVEVTDIGGGQVSFKFKNAGPLASSITDVYFDDGTLLGIASVSGGSGVVFTQDATPGNLPGANNAVPDFETTAGFSADSTSPTQPNGVNPGEELTIIFDLIGGKTFAETIAAIEGPLLEGDDLRIGIHVQGFGNGQSESFINDPIPLPDPIDPVSTPEPTSLAIWCLGMVAAGIGARRMRKQK
jgi:PEP-CTERM motif